jgi:hypothetical protein
MSAREDILRRIRGALRDVPAGSGPGETEVPWEFGLAGPSDSVADLFADRTAEYRATVVETDLVGVGEAVATALAGSGGTTPDRARRPAPGVACRRPRRGDRNHPRHRTAVGHRP